MKIRKIVIPAAGFGTRFLPATKAQPKEMLPIVDKPIIQYIVEEAVQAGIEEVILITGSNKRSIEDHFDYNFELEYRLQQSGKTEVYKEIRRISDMAKFIYVRQKEQLGNGHAVLMAREVVGDEPFVVMFGDEYLYSTPPRTEQLIKTYDQYHGSILSMLTQSDPKDAEKYGFVKGTPVTDTIMKVESLMEKPGIGNEPSKFYLPTGYVLSPTIFEILATLKPGKAGEIWLVDAINELTKREAVYGMLVENARYYDCGNKFGYLQANVEFALRDPVLGKDVRGYLKQLDLS